MESIGYTPLREEILAYYNKGQEAGRLFRGIGPLELARMQELLIRYLPAPPATVLDVGGGPGIYSCWLARRGYRAHLIDATPLHIYQARQASAAQPSQPIASIDLGDARRLEFPNAIADAVLMHGPLYHLLERADRLAALSEAKRVLRPGGVLLAVAVPRYASIHVGLLRGWIDNSEYRQMVECELNSGRHVQPPHWPHLFTTSYFHYPDELKAEVEEAGLSHEITLAIEGPGWIVPDFEACWQDQRRRENLLSIVRLMEREAVAIGMSAHMMAIARK